MSTVEYIPKGIGNKDAVKLHANCNSGSIGTLIKGFPCIDTFTGGSNDDVEIENCARALPLLHERLFRMSSEVLFPSLRSPPCPSGGGESADRVPFETSKTETYAMLNKEREAEGIYWPIDSAGRHSSEIKLCCIRSPLPRS